MDKSTYLGSIQQPENFLKSDSIINMICSGCQSISELNKVQVDKIAEVAGISIPDQLEKKYVQVNFCPECPENISEEDFIVQFLDVN